MPDNPTDARFGDPSYKPTAADWGDFLRLIGKAIRLYPGFLYRKLFPKKGDYPQWDETAKVLIESKKYPEVIEITRQGAARGQIESAILLWFLEADAAAIHTLAVAAQGVAHGVGDKVGKPSYIVQLIQSQSKAFQRAARLPQNFFKHASTDPQQVLPYRPGVGEALLVDAVQTYINVFETPTPLMVVFQARITLEQPALLGGHFTASKFVMGAKIDDLAELTRSRFMQVCLDRIYDHLNPPKRRVGAAHIESITI